jgi:hypothetical protein
VFIAYRFMFIKQTQASEYLTAFAFELYRLSISWDIHCLLPERCIRSRISLRPFAPQHKSQSRDGALHNRCLFATGVTFVQRDILATPRIPCVLSSLALE